MANYVLVAGFWLGGWAWKSVTDALRSAGHNVYPATLTGLGERVHLGGPQVNLDTHIADVVNLIKFEDLQDVILVGHSYAGVVVTGVADRIPDLIGKLVYVDTAPLPDGVAQAEFAPPEQQKLTKKHVDEEGDGWRLPMPPWEEMGQGNVLDGLGKAERAFMRSRATDMPYNASLQPISLTNPARAQIPKVAIWCSFTSEAVRGMIAEGNKMFSELTGPEWKFVDLPTGHWPMFSRPDDLAGLLLAEA